MPFFRHHRFARQIILTKSADVDDLLGLDHGGHTILSWSLNPPSVSSQFETNLPSVEERIEAMKKCADAGYPIRAVLMPVIPVENWKTIYAEFIQKLLIEVPIQRLTMGGICSYKNAIHLMETISGENNPVSCTVDSGRPDTDGRRRYPRSLRVHFYKEIIAAAKKAKPDLELALCLEDRVVLKVVGLDGSLGKCNCVL
jgi:spore photoproduct lyase